jgi:hypothetical protein
MNPTIEKIRALLDSLENAPAAAELATGDLVQIHDDADHAYRGLLGIIQRNHGRTAQVSILRPHRGGLRFSVPTIALNYIGRTKTGPGILQWCDQVDQA